METADSNISKAICAITNKLTKINERELPVFPINVNNKCPAIILAVNRTANVPGRITLLIVSMHTIKGIKTLGVP
jgi:hypothetical protein